MTISDLFQGLDTLVDEIWFWFGFPAILLLGLYFSYRSKLVQVRRFPQICKLFLGFLKKGEKGQGVHPLAVFFAAIGGAIGIGNLVVVCTAVQIGGPGAVFWIWVTALLGMLLKYAEVFLGVKYRVPNSKGGYDGGPMFYLQKAFSRPWVAYTACTLLAIYGVEILMFKVVTDTVVINWGLNRYLVIAVLLAMVLFSGAGGVARVGRICSTIIPGFLLIFLTMGLYVLFMNLDQVPAILGSIFSGAFTGTAAVGGFAGSTAMMAISQGVARGAYTGDVGVGYASTIHSETRETKPARQASLAIMGIFLDTFVVCTLTLFSILVTGVWSQPLDASVLVQSALDQYFPYMWIFMPFFLFLLGYSTIIAYFCTGIKCARFLGSEKAVKIFYCYAITAWLLFSFLDSSQALAIMSAAGAGLLILNLAGFYKLRKEVEFDF